MALRDAILGTAQRRQRTAAAGEGGGLIVQENLSETNSTRVVVCDVSRWDKCVWGAGGRLKWDLSKWDAGDLIADESTNKTIAWDRTFWDHAVTVAGD